MTLTLYNVARSLPEGYRIVRVNNLAKKKNFSALSMKMVSVLLLEKERKKKRFHEFSTMQLRHECVFTIICEIFFSF